MEIMRSGDMMALRRLSDKEGGLGEGTETSGL